MNTNRLLSFFYVLDQLNENSYQLSKCCYGTDTCLVITYLFGNNLYKNCFEYNTVSCKDLHVLYNTLYGDYMSTIINQIDKVFEESYNDLNFFHITKLNDIIDNYKLFNNE